MMMMKTMMMMMVMMMMMMRMMMKLCGLTSGDPVFLYCRPSELVVLQQLPQAKDLLCRSAASVGSTFCHPLDFFS